MPGSSGAIITPAEIPFSTKHSIASNRACGRGVPGSVSFQTSSSTLPMLKLTCTSATSLSSRSTSTSRRTKTPLVVMEAGFRKSTSTRRMRRVSSYCDSAGS